MDSEEISIKPGLGWTNFDDTISVENKTNETIYVMIWTDDPKKDIVCGID